MAFRIEKIKTAEQQAEFAAIGIKWPGSQSPVQVLTWVVDRERGLFFVDLGGGGGDMPQIMVLADRSGNVLEAYGDLEESGSFAPNSMDVVWKIKRIRVPPLLESRKKELAAALKEALEAYGCLGEVGVARSVMVTMASPTLN